MWRTHQSELLTLCDRLARHEVTAQHIVASVTPGGGKSALPVILAHHLIPAIADRVCWLVPRASLGRQGQEAFESSLFRGMLGHRMYVGSSPGAGWGFVATYQALLYHKEAYRREFLSRRYILVLDEPHHAPDASQWAAALRPLVNSCSLLVQMSGTFQRHDMQPVAFLPYVHMDGQQVFDLAAARRQGVATLEYSRKDALREQAVIPLEVRWFDLSATWKEDGQQQTLFSLAEIEDESEAKEGIYIALRSGAGEAILTECYQDWCSYRQTNTRSKLLVVAATVGAAKSFLSLLETLGATRVAIATSDESTQAYRNIERFKSHGGDRLDILVTVAMAYEGMDAPSCTHIACLTNIRSAPWIEQMATRATRVDRGEGALPYEMQAAYLYCPDDVLMRQCVEVIIEGQEAIAREPREVDDDGEEDGVGVTDAFGDDIDDEAEERSFEALEGDATLYRLTDLQGGGLTRKEIDQLPILSRVTGTPESVLRSLRIEHIKGQLQAYSSQIEAFNSEHLQPVAVGQLRVVTVGSASELRKKATELSNRLDTQRGWAPGTANGMVRRQFKKSRTKMSPEELDRVCTWLERQIGRVGQAFARTENCEISTVSGEE
ncbi:MAG: DEAD/DEAH box helicase family protein [Cyanobacteria bacterium J06607_6]